MQGLSEPLQIIIKRFCEFGLHFGLMHLSLFNIKKEINVLNEVSQPTPTPDSNLFSARPETANFPNFFVGLKF